MHMRRRAVLKKIKAAKEELTKQGVFDEKGKAHPDIEDLFSLINLLIHNQITVVEK